MDKNIEVMNKILASKKMPMEKISIERFGPQDNCYSLHFRQDHNVEEINAIQKMLRPITEAMIKDTAEGVKEFSLLIFINKNKVESYGH